MMTTKTIIRPSKGWVLIDFKELWHYRELLGFLTWRDILVRYKQTFLGVAWAVIQPVMTMVIFSIIFGRLAKLPSDNVPYPVFSFAALLPWNLFASALNRSTTSVVGSSSLVTKIYFPRVIIPIASTLSTLVDFLISLAVFVLIMLYYGFKPGIFFLTVPLLMILTVATALGVGLWLSALNVKYRDVSQAIPFIVQAWMYVSPVAYALSLIPSRWSIIYALNPMVGVIEGFRWALIGRSAWPQGSMMVSLSVTLLLLVTGALFFRRMERTFADIV
ncbi:MAG: ABC transporter permease [Candidatus Edwardsbacteria bacterium]|nr:ABC transporter permease [Candidatus Edwardsbacteria bacterium]